MAENLLPLRVTARPDVFVRVLEGEAVILNVRTGFYFGLDEVGTRMWDVLSVAPSVQKAYELLLEEYEVEPDRLRGDLIEFVGRLREHELVECSAG